MSYQEIQQLVNAIDTAAYNLRHTVKRALDPMAHRPNASAVEKTESFRRLQMADAGDSFVEMSVVMDHIGNALDAERRRQGLARTEEEVRWRFAEADKEQAAEEAVDEYNDTFNGDD